MGENPVLVGELRICLWPVIEPIVEEEGLELLEIELIQQRGDWVLRIYMDREGGVNLDDCERVSRRVSPVLDVEDLIPHRYTLEVSSPGIPRPLRKASDFERFSGQPARIEMAVSSTLRKRYSGELAGVSSGFKPEVMLKLENGEIAHLPIEHIKRARLMMDLQ